MEERMPLSRLDSVLAGMCVVALVGCMAHGGSAMSQRSSQSAPFSADTTAAVVRYQVRDVDRAVGFYTRHLGFGVTQRSGPVAILTRGELRLLMSGPGSSGSRPMPDGRQQEPGGWNRIVLYVDNVDTTVAALKAAGARFRNDVEVGPGGKQIQVDDPDGNPIELHEAPKQ
jgi:glyoxylase I family protein